MDLLHLYFKSKPIFLFKMDDSNINMVKISDDGIDEEYELDDLPALVYFRYNQFSIFFFYQIQSFKNGRVIRPNACCVFRPANMCSSCRLQGEIICFCVKHKFLLSFSISNGKKESSKIIDFVVTLLNKLFHSVIDQIISRQITAHYNL